MNAAPDLNTSPRNEFQHRHAAHCESGVMANLLSHHGLALSEAMAFGLASALAFAYIPFVKLGGLPLIAYRMPPKAIIKGLSKRLGLRMRFETFRSPAAGQARLDALLAQGRPVGLQTSVFWLPYFPEDMRFHFNAHNLLVYGKDGGAYRISDPVFETPVSCAAADLQKARFAKGALAPKGLLYFPERPPATVDLAPLALNAIRRNAKAMLAPFPLVGCKGIAYMAKRIAQLKAGEHEAESLRFIGHVVRMQEEIGTGGAGFRFLYASFLQEAAELTGRAELSVASRELTAIGDHWREFALAAALMVRGRKPFAPAALAESLKGIAEAERGLFGGLAKLA
ncbi:MAG: BtrH N-terminal domain-containing protein [Gammaproteobacteria bacterium]|nr:BtrH N-terminal domain-containing protein [Gammaproteobacteria bacterium]